MLSDELRNHLCRNLIPFWEKLRDKQFGGYFGWMDSRLDINFQAVKGCILNSRILWFFSNAYIWLQNSDLDAVSAEVTLDSLEECARWAYRFLSIKCLDREQGGIYWSVDYQGCPEDTTKHTYNQAFAVYA